MIIDHQSHHLQTNLGSGNREDAKSTEYPHVWFDANFRTIHATHTKWGDCACQQWVLWIPIATTRHYKGVDWFAKQFRDGNKGNTIWM